MVVICMASHDTSYMVILRRVSLYGDFSIIFSLCLGAKPAPQNGTDVLLDLLSIGTPPAQSISSAPDILSSVQDNKIPLAPLDGLLSPTSHLAQATPAKEAPVIDLLDGFAAKPSIPGKIWAYFEVLLWRWFFNVMIPPFF